MKRAFLIFGMEGSGTNMMAEALVAAGCRHVYETDEINDEDELIVIRRSYPHAGEEPNMIKIIEGLTRMYLTTLFIFRDENASQHSVMHRDKNRSFESVVWNALAFWDFLSKFIHFNAGDTTHVTYEAFTSSESYRKWLFEERLYLPFPADYKVENRNLKYYE